MKKMEVKMTGKKKVTEKISYEQWCKEFSWEKEFARTDWDSKKELNVAHESCESWAEKQPDRIMFYWVGKDLDERETWAYGQLNDRSNQVANMLRELGVKRGDVVAMILPRRPEMIAVHYGIWKMGAIAAPLFPALGAEAIEFRARDANIKYIIADTNYRPVIDKIKGHKFEKIITVSYGGEIPSGDVDFALAADKASKEFEIVRTSPEDPCSLIYSSGTTGLPKGEVWHHQFIISFLNYLEYVADVRPGELVWNGADPGWAVGQAAITGPSFIGARFIFFEGMFDPIKYFRILSEYDVDEFMHAPTAYRGMMAAGDAIDEYKDRIDLKVASALGEATPASVVEWFRDKLGITVLDTYGYSEAMMIVNNYSRIDMEIKPGSMGLPSPAWDTDIIDDDGNRLGPGQIGEIAPRNDKGIFLTKEYLNRPEASEKLFRSEWRRSGDLAMKDEDGYFWFQGRKDDVINSSGYRIGPEEVEGSILRHKAVADCAVAGKPDEDRGEIVKAFVKLKEGFEPSDKIVEEIQQLVREGVGKHAYPREVEFIDEIPATPAGKIQRFKLREREKGKQ